MTWKSLLAHCLPRIVRSEPSRRTKPRHSHVAETLEERLLLSGMTIKVTNTNDAGEGSLRAAIALANTNEGTDTIRFARSARGEIGLSSQLVITDDLILDGPGASHLIVSGEGATRVFAVVPPSLDEPIDVEFRDITIADGLATDAIGFPPEFGFAFGGGIYNLGSTITLSRVRMVDNQAGDGTSSVIGAGGAIANEFGGTLTVSHSHFSGNLALGVSIASGGAITQDIGPSFDDMGLPDDGTGPATLWVSHSTFQDNRSEALENNPAAVGDLAPFAGFAFGGAIANFASHATVTHTTFVGNTAKSGDGMNGNQGGTGSGGAIKTSDFSPFDADAVPGQAGPNTDGIPGRNSSLLIEHSRFFENSVMGGTGDGDAQGGAANGGAVSGSIGFFPETGIIRHSTFESNTATGGEGGMNGGKGGTGTGGAIAAVSGTSFQVERCRFFDNTSKGGQGGEAGRGGDGRGGAIGLANLVTSVQTPDGANLFDALPSRVEINRSSFLRNQAAAGFGGENGWDGNGLGGAIGLSNGASGEVSHSSIQKNWAEGLGGGIYNTGSLDVEKTTIRGNQAIGNANSIIIASPAFQIVGGGKGGGIANYGSLELRRVDVVDNHAIGADDASSGTNSFLAGEPVFPGSASGGGLSNSGGFATAFVTDSRFIGNTAQAGDRGFGEFAATAGGGAISNDTELTILGSRFRDNQAIAGDDSTSPLHNGHALGGAINSGSLDAGFGGPSATLTVIESVLTRNQAIGGNNNHVLAPVELISPADGPNNGYGGGITVFQGSVRLDKSSLRNNRAIGGDGGAAFNGSFGVGGGAFFFSFIGPVSAAVTQSQLIGNVALGGEEGDGIGGGIATGTLGAVFGLPGLTHITHTSFRNNRALGGDGANAGDGIGGGLAVVQGGIANVSASAFLFNRARGGDGLAGGHGQGGAVAVMPDGELSLTHNIVAGNRAIGGSGSDTDGDGLGGGGFNSGNAEAFELDAFTWFWMQFNSATDEGDALFGLFDLI